MVMAFIPSDAPDTRNKNIYGSGMGISIVIEIFSNFPFLVGGVNPRGHT
jgi:hypothetical protein